MKWRVDIEYEDGSFTEPRRIAFQAVYDGEPYHGYDTKREALEAFCRGQVSIGELRKGAEKEQHKINPCEPQTNREDMDFDTGQSYTWEQKEGEAEQKKEEGWDKAIKEAKEKYGYGRLEERIDVVRDFSPKEEAEQKKGEEKKVKVNMSEGTRKRLEKFAPISIIKIGWKAEAETSPYDGSITRVSFCEVEDGYPTKEEALIAFVEEQKGKKYGDNFLPPEGYTNGNERKIMERLEALEKKAKEEIKPYELSDTDDIIEASKKIAKEPSFARYVYSVEIMKADHGHRLDNIEAHIAKIEERLTEIDSAKDDSKDELKISKLDVASQKIDLLLTFLEAVCRNLGNDIKKIK